MNRRMQAAGKLPAHRNVSIQGVPPVKRLGAFMIDYAVSAIFISVIPMLITSIVTQEKMFTAAVFAEMPLLWQAASGIAALFSGGYYFIVYPMKEKHLGQTPGKQIMKIRVKAVDGQELTWSHMLRRELIGSMAVEGETAFPSSFLRYFLYMLIPSNVVGWLAGIAVALSVMSVLWAVFHEKHRMFHDYIGGTVVEGAP